MDSIQEIIVKTAKSYVGQEEIKGNRGFKDPLFEEKMKNVGFVNGYAWCALFTELVWREAYAQTNGIIQEECAKLFSASVVATKNNFKKAGWVVNSQPVPGALIVWQKYKGDTPTAFGHIGIVTELSGSFDVITVEGNTSNKPNDREGFIVAEKKHRVVFNSGSGLNLIGFVHPKEP